MFEASFSLFQLIGISFLTFLVGTTIGAEVGKAVQKKRDIWMFGPKFMRREKSPKWLRKR